MIFVPHWVITLTLSIRFNSTTLVPAKTDTETAVRELLEKLPRANQHLLQGVLILADQIVANSKWNMMGAENMSRVLGPNFLWQEGHATKQADFSLELLTRANNLTDFMIDHHATLFPPPVSSFGISSTPEVHPSSNQMR